MDLHKIQKVLTNVCFALDAEKERVAAQLEKINEEIAKAEEKNKLSGGSNV